MIKWLARYAAYLTFAGAAPISWLMFAYLVFGILPLPGDPACHFEPEGCPERPMIVQAFGTISLFASFPLTVLAFTRYRKAVRHSLGLPEARSAQ